MGGLAAYEPEHADYFCGRQALTAELVRQAARAGLRGTPLIVIGPSGSGNSPLLRAGLIPALCCDDPSGASGRSSYLLFTPGASPVLELAAQLAGWTGESPESVHDKLLADPRSCADLIATRVLIVVDQFEELFSSCEDETQQQVLIQALCAAAAPSALVVLGMRADFYPHVLRVPQLVPVLQNAQLVVGPMTETELRQAITEPARRAGLSLEPALVEVLLHDIAPTGEGSVNGAAHGAGALPLLSHALLATWEQASGRTLTVEHCRATGGIRGAVATTAEAVFSGLATPERQDIARRLFLRLVRTDDDTTDTRRRVSAAGLVSGCAFAEVNDIDDIDEVLDRFIDARLLTIDGDTIEITHEALVTAWPRLREWLDADALWRRCHRRLTAAARHWQETSRDPGSLYRGGALETAREWVEDCDRRRKLDPLESEFLDARLTLQAGEGLKARRRVRRRYQLIALVSVLALVLAGVAVYARQVQLRERSSQWPSVPTAISSRPGEGTS